MMNQSGGLLGCYQKVRVYVCVCVVCVCVVCVCVFAEGTIFKLRQGFDMAKDSSTYTVRL